MSDLRKAAEEAAEWLEWLLKEDDSLPPINCRVATDNLRAALEAEHDEPVGWGVFTSENEFFGFRRSLNVEEMAEEELWAKPLYTHPYRGKK